MKPNMPLRTAQIDASQLDKSVYNALSEIVSTAVPDAMSPVKPEIALALKLAIHMYSVMKHDATFGQKLMNLKYSDLTTNKKMAYFVPDVIEYIKIRESSLPTPSSVKNVLLYIKPFQSLMSGINAIFFLKYGWKSLLIERLLNLVLICNKVEATPPPPSRYLTRELLWNVYIEILTYILPFLNYPKLANALNSLTGSVKTVAAAGLPVLAADTKCPHCSKHPTMPHHMGCSHVFCYSCLKSNKIADENYKCPTCGFGNSKQLVVPFEARSNLKGTGQTENEQKVVK